MARLREQQQLKNVSLSEINIPPAPVERLKVESFIQIEQIKPITLTPGENGKYVVVDGRRRIQAMIKQHTEDDVPPDLTKIKILAIIKQGVEGQRFHLEALAANSGTTNAMDEANHIQALIDEGLESKQIANMTALPYGKVRELLRLKTDLIPEFQELLLVGDIPHSTCVVIFKMPVDKQKELYKMWEAEDGLSGKDVRSFYKAYVNEKAFVDVEFAEPDTAIVPGLYVRPEFVDKLLSGEEVVIEYQGQEIKIRKA